MKRLLVLLVLLVGGLVAAALSVPTNAAVVNGTAISQQQLNSDVSAIAGSPYYQCYLNSEDYLASNGSQCGKRSAYSKPGGYTPLCYPSDISDEAVKAWRARHGEGQ